MKRILTLMLITSNLAFCQTGSFKRLNVDTVGAFKKAFILDTSRTEVTRPVTADSTVEVKLGVILDSMAIPSSPTQAKVIIFSQGVGKLMVKYSNGSVVNIDSAAPASSGEANTASNLGGGLANFDSKSGVDLRFNSFKTADFDLASNLLSLDYVNGQMATGSVNGFLSSGNWTTFNNKQATISVTTPITLSGASIGMVNQGTTTTVLHGNASGNPAFSSIVAADLPGSFNGFANPTGTIGLSTVNGSLATAMRSDAAPLLDQAIAPTWTSAHTWTVLAPQIILNNGTRNRIQMGANGIGSPTQTTYSNGTKLVLFDNISSSSTGYATGIESNNMWFTVGLNPSVGVGYKWYYGGDAGVNPAMLLDNSNLTLGSVAGTGVGSLYTGSITATGAITGSNLSGTNTGNQTITLTSEVTGSGTGSFATTIDKTISPTWTGAHVFNGGLVSQNNSFSNNVRIGTGTTVGNGTIAIGNSTTGGTNSVVVGYSGNGTSSSAVSVGFSTTNSSSGTVAIGASSSTAGIEGIAIGHGASTNGIRSSSFGSIASAPFDSSAAFGHDAIADAKYHIMLGTTKDTTVFPSGWAIANDIRVDLTTPKFRYQISGEGSTQTTDSIRFLNSPRHIWTRTNNTISVEHQTPTTAFELFDDWVSTGGVGNQGWTVTVTGTGAAVTNYNGTAPNANAFDSSRVGIMQMTTGTTATGVADLNLGVASLFASGGAITMECTIFLDTLSNATNRYAVTLGLGDVLTSAAYVDGLWFSYRDDLVAGQWAANISQNSTITTLATNVTVAAQTWYRLRIDINADGSSATFYVNANATTPAATNMPKTSARLFAPNIKITKSVGTVAKTMELDYYYIKKSMTRAR